MAILPKQDLSPFYRKFFKEKTIQRTDKFHIDINSSFIDPVNRNVNLGSLKRLVIERTGGFPEIQPHHVVNVTFPTYEFTKETIGWTQIPSFAFQGFEFSVLFEEDQYGTIQKAVNWFQKRTIDPGGLHYPTDFAKIASIGITILTEHDVPITKHNYTGVHFLRATPMSYDYTSTTAQKISITFVGNNLEFWQNSGQSLTDGGSINKEIKENNNRRDN